MRDGPLVVYQDVKREINAAVALPSSYGIRLRVRGGHLREPVSTPEAIGADVAVWLAQLVLSTGKSESRKWNAGGTCVVTAEALQRPSGLSGLPVVFAPAPGAWYSG
jgi:hypothetical protein